ncbi:hypothetical protein SAMN02746041_03220 [Desulfacinum hydrothermale DSM 13146]|uniref:Uncharacterized protein n=1 Tax=Desulfacinum hydrothermale DSM 13146 TaxID=1121390 RepID=A0A1W1XXN0_9BACT|nr:hypothetical protein [Desulfacinum hydrothermale]SMC28268.1 hypothetical protein SAMN02746041_03220 [Desulfacinum hydrothermale DSM 13146]
MKGYGLYHRLSNGDDLPSFIDTVLENNGAMVSTVEKLRAGIPAGGMSPEADIDTGGATYFSAASASMWSSCSPTRNRTWLQTGKVGGSTNRRTGTGSSGSTRTS